MVHHRIPQPQQSRDRLCGVQCTAAADADHGVEGVVVKLRHDTIHEVRRGLAGHAYLLPGEALRAQRLVEPGAAGRRVERGLSGHQQKALAVAARNVRQTAQAARAEFDARQARDGERGNHVEAVSAIAAVA